MEENQVDLKCDGRARTGLI